MATAWMRVALTTATVVVIGCGATVTHVRGPDGEDNWVAIECKGSSANCYEAAGEECPNGYAVADRRNGSAGTISTARASGTLVRNGGFGASYSGTATGFSREIYEGEMLIKCQSGGRSAASTTDGHPSRAVEREEAQEQALSGSDQKDYSQCNAAFAHIEDLAALWSEWFQGEAVDRPPRHDPFVLTCGYLDEDTQLCLNVTFANAHHDACLARLQGLSSVTRQKLDHLFLKSAQ